MSSESSFKSGAELLYFYKEYFPKGSLKFLNNIDLEPYQEEIWTSNNFADNLSYESTSEAGSKFSMLITSTLADNIETTGLDFTFLGSDGAKLVQKSSGKQPPNDGFGPITGSLNFDWAYAGDKKDKSDDLKLSMKISANDVLSPFGNGWQFTGSSSFNAAFDAGSGTKQFKLLGGDTYSVTGFGYNSSSDLNSANFTVAYSDLTDNAIFKLSLTLTLDTDAVANTTAFSFKNVSAQMGGLKITTAIYSGTLTEVDLGLGDLLDIDNLTPLLRDQWVALIAKGNNSYIGGISSDTIDASSGNDTINGNRGNDFLKGGTGYDQITGGAGSDVFIFSAGDSTVSATLADLIKDFKYKESDLIQLIGLSPVLCQVGTAKSASFDVALTIANRDFSAGSNVSIQFVGKNGLMFVDMDGNDQADLAVTLVGLKAGDAGFANYAKSGAMFTS